MKPILEHDGKRFEVLSSAGYPRPGEWVLGTNGSDVKPIRAPMDFCSSTITTLRELPCHTNGKPILRADVPFNGTYEVWTTDCPPDIPANTQNASRESLKFVRKLGERVWSRVIDAPPLIEVGSVRCKTYSGNFLCVNCGHFVNIQVPVGLEKKNFVISTVKCPICETYCLTK